MQYVWDLFVRIFHWSLVIAFTVAFLTHDSEWYRVTHSNAGYVAGALLLARIGWGFMKTGYANFDTFPLHPIEAIQYVWLILHGHAKRFIGHNPAGSIVIYAMLATGLITVGSGFLVYNEGWLLDQPEVLQAVHYYAAWSWLGLVIIHVGGVVTESALHHDNLISAMFTGFKRNSTENEE